MRWKGTPCDLHAESLDGSRGECKHLLRDCVRKSSFKFQNSTKALKLELKCHCDFIHHYQSVIDVSHLKLQELKTRARLFKASLA